MWHHCFPLSHQAFVKMAGHHVSFLEAHVLQAERDHGALSQALRKWLGSSGLPAFGNVSIPYLPAPSQTLEQGEGLRKQEFKGHGWLLQTGNSIWPAGGELARWLECCSASLVRPCVP